MIIEDTIVAQATPPGKGGVAIVRISGPNAFDIGMALINCTSSQNLKPRYAYFRQFLNERGACIDEGIMLYFPGPNSFTGENVVEIQGHGGPYVVQQLIARICDLGARQAQPGEFSKRAFLNDKIDLTQAEAIADLIDAQSVQAANCAMASLQGQFSSQISNLAQSLLHIRIYVEAAMDFPEEEIDFLQDETLKEKVDFFLLELKAVLHGAQRGVKLRDGLSIAILGAPNAGKSSLLNQLSGEETAIVTDIAGTTRDVLKCDITLAGYPLQIADTAGLRETDNLVEQEGIRRAKSAAQSAEHVFFLIDAQSLAPSFEVRSELLNTLELNSEQVTVILNKVDMLSVEQSTMLSQKAESSHVLLSAKTGQGLDHLARSIEKLAGGRAEESVFTARQRHINALESAYGYCNVGYDHLLVSGSGELFAEDLKLAHQKLGEITGQVSSDDLLGHIFSSFCIGK